MAPLRRKFRPKPAPQSDQARQEEQQLLDALGVLRGTTAREVMTHRVDVVALQAPVTVGDVAQAVRQSGHSRFPVYEESIDNLLGVLFVKDLFRSETPLAEVPVPKLRKPFLVPESRLVLDILAAMRQGRNGFAVVVDEYGGVEGVVTVKDLISELVGELPDEFDQAEEAPIVRVDADRWLVAGDCPVDDVGEALSLKLPEGEYVTLGGFLFDRFGHIPEEGETLTFAGWEFRVTDMDRRRVDRVVVRAPAGFPADAGGDGGRGGRRSAVG